MVLRTIFWPFKFTWHPAQPPSSHSFRPLPQEMSLKPINSSTRLHISWILLFFHLAHVWEASPGILRVEKGKSREDSASTSQHWSCNVRLARLADGHLTPIISQSSSHQAGMTTWGEYESEAGGCWGRVHKWWCRVHK